MDSRQTTRFSRRAYSLAAFCVVGALALSVQAAVPDLGMMTPPTEASSATTTDGAIAPVRANVSLTTNALLGFVNAQPVFVQDMFRPIDDELRGLAQSSRDISAFRSAARVTIERQMRSYVSDIVLISAAKNALAPEDEGRLDVFINVERSKMLSKYGGSRAMMDQALKAEGTTLDKKMEDLRRHKTVELYLYKELYPKIVVTRSMVMEEYERSTTKTQQAEIELFTITLPLTRWMRGPSVDGKRGPIITSPNAQQIADAERQALAAGNEIVDRVKKGADFAELAEDYRSADDRVNYGGRWPKVTPGSLANKTLEDAAFALPANTVGKPLMLLNDDLNKSAVVVIKVGQKKESRTIPFAEAQKSIADKLRDRQYRDLTNDYMDKLSKGAAIEAVQRMTEVALDVAVTRYATQ